jgi:hypothetical protein
MLNSDIDWAFIAKKIDEKRFVPILSNRVIQDTLFDAEGAEGVVRAWADSIDYPLADGHNLTRVAQFLSVTRQDPAWAKFRYLQFLKQSLFESARGESGADQSFLEGVRNEIRTLTFSKLAAKRLNHPDFGQGRETPLSILATLDVPVYLTTSYHLLMEDALKAVGKTPRTEVYCWQQGLEQNIPPECASDPTFEPGINTPLVYHLHGVDIFTDSLVLTEDDHLEFLVNVTQDFREVDMIPSTVRNALTNGLLALLGYELHAWDLRVLLQGVIKDSALRPGSVAIQLMPGQAQGIKNSAGFQQYLQKYFGQVNISVYWGDPHTFVETLRKEWEKGWA